MDKYCLGFLIVILSITSCDKDKVNLIEENDHLIFGTFYGFCGGEGCIETFKLTETALYEDTKDGYRANDGFSFLKLSNEKFNMVKDIADAIPSALLEEEEKTFGCPDCYDQGGLMIQVLSDGKAKTWYLDRNKMSIPAYLHAISDSIYSKIELINQ